MKNKQILLLIIILIGLTLLVIILGVFLFSQAPRRESPQQDGQIPTPIEPHSQTSGQEPPFPSPNPTFIELLKTQPFWDMLPHYGESYLVEYFQSGDTIIITTVDPGNVPDRSQLMNEYRQEARDWLVANGAVLNELTIDYRPDITTNAQ